MPQQYDWLSFKRKNTSGIRETLSTHREVRKKISLSQTSPLRYSTLEQCLQTSSQRKEALSVLQPTKSVFSRVQIQGWRDGSVTKTTGCSCRGPEFSSSTIGLHMACSSSMGISHPLLVSKSPVHGHRHT